MNRSLVIFAEKDSRRLRYLSRLLFDLHLGLDWSITTKSQAYDAFKGARINYSSQPLEGGVQILPSGLLFEDKIVQHSINTSIYRGLQVPFANDGPVFPFDPLSAIFYLISRYEEYLPFEPNQYGQFKATDSMAYKLGFLDQPVVEIWLAALKEELEKVFPALDCIMPQFKTTFTYDIDVAYAYKGRNFGGRWAGMAYDLATFNISKLRDRWQVMWGLKKDPFDTYDHIRQQRDIHGHNIIFFFLLGEKNAYNHNISPRSALLKDLIKEISTLETTGIHPSYYADSNQQLLQREIKILHTITGQKITKSRQHYLRMKFPATFLHLTQSGITQDFTIGFAEMPGFRAGTCNPFYFYDLHKNASGSLLMQPITLMEGSFIDDMKMTPDETLQRMLKLAETVKKVNGHFISIWHNHTLSNQDQWKGLKNVHDQLAAFLAKPGD